MEWGNDNRTLFYARQDPETLRSFQIYRHVLGNDPAQDELVFEEPDETFSVFVAKSKSKRFLMIGLHQTVSSEYWYLNADTPGGTFQVFHPRERGHEYDVDHLGEHFFIRTNDQAKNFRLMKTEVNVTHKTQWQEVIPHCEDVFFEGFELFREYLVVEERKHGLIHLRILPNSEGQGHELDFGEPAYLAALGDNYEIEVWLYVHDHAYDHL
jgi:oligopeptidase B